jgi:hypothetical protein
MRTFLLLTLLNHSLCANVLKFGDLQGTSPPVGGATNGIPSYSCNYNSSVIDYQENYVHIAVEDEDERTVFTGLKVYIPFF